MYLPKILTLSSEHVALYDSIVPCYDYFISPVFPKMFSNPFILEQIIKYVKM